SAQTAHRGPAQTGQIPAAPKHLAKVARDRANVGAGATPDVDVNVDVFVVPIDSKQVDGVHGHAPRLQLHLLSTARKTVCRPPPDLQSRERRWPLLDGAHEGSQRGR